MADTARAALAQASTALSAASESIKSYAYESLVRADDPEKQAFQRQYTLAQRVAFRRQVAAQHPRHIVVVVEKNARDAALVGDITKNKFIIDPTTSVGMFTSVLRRRYISSANCTHSIWLATEDGRIVSPPSQIIGHWERIAANRDDGILYLTYTSENTFG